MQGTSKYRSSPNKRRDLVVFTRLCCALTLDFHVGGLSRLRPAASRRLAGASCFDFVQTKITGQGGVPLGSMTPRSITPVACHFVVRHAILAIYMTITSRLASGYSYRQSFAVTDSNMIKHPWCFLTCADWRQDQGGCQSSLPLSVMCGLRLALACACMP